MLDVPRTRTEDEWVARLVRAEGVVVHPGYFFEFGEDGYLVMSLLPPPELFRDAVHRAIQRLAQA